MIRHELRVLRRDGILTIAIGVVVVATLAALLNGALWAERQRVIIDEVQRDEAVRFEQVTRRLRAIEAKQFVTADPYEDPSRPSIAGGWLAYRFATMPPPPLAALTVGQTDLTPAYAGVTLWSTAWPSWLNRRVLVGESEIDNPLNLAAGRFDLAFVVVYLLPILILALMHDLVAEEREGGTLTLLASQPVRLPTAIAAKLAARMLIVGFALALLTVAAFVATFANGGDAALRLGWWSFGASLYTGFWCAVAACLSTWRGSAARAAARLAVAWVALVIVLPAALNAITGWRYPLPERAVMVQRARDAQLAAERENSALTETFYDEHPSLAPADARRDVRQYAATTVYAEQQEVERQIAPIVAAFTDRLAAQTRLIDRLSVLSPVSATTAALADAAGAGPERSRHFRDQVDQFRTKWRAYFVPRLFRLERIAASDVAFFPRFVFVEEDASDVGTRARGRGFGLFVPTLVLFAWTAARLRRVTVLD